MKPQDDDKKKKKKVLANIKSPIIDALIGQRYVFSDMESAADKVQYIEQRFVRSSLADSVDDNATVIWIRGFEITEDEKKEGFVGNYAVVAPEMMPDGKYSVSCRKIEIEASKHPQRKRRKGKHPDWGYWVMRRISKNWRYGSIDEAYADLMKLAEDYPEVSIPAQNKLYTILYRKTDDDSLPLFRVILEVEALPEGGFTITCKENTYKRDEDKPKPKETETEEPQQVGRFTSMVAVKRNKRKNIADYVKDSEDEQESDETTDEES